MTRDKELEDTIQRALSLRITLREISDYTGVNHVTLWRWRHEVSPRFMDRQMFLDGLNHLIDQQQAYYAGV